MLVGGGGGAPYISPEHDRQCGEVKGRALKIHTASSKGSLAQELCSLTYIHRSPSAATACPACLQLLLFPPDPVGGCHICSLHCRQPSVGTWEQSSASLGLAWVAGGLRCWQRGTLPRSTLAVPILPTQHPGCAWGLATLASGTWREKAGWRACSKMSVYIGHTGLICWHVRWVVAPGQGSTAGMELR